jgi:hypothetical protein
MFDLRLGAGPAMVAGLALECAGVALIALAHGANAS